MRPQSQSSSVNPRVTASLPFVEQLARRVAATMPHSIDIGDLVQDGVIGLIDAAHRFDEADRKSTRLNSSHSLTSRMPSSA